MFLFQSSTVISIIMQMTLCCICSTPPQISTCPDDLFYWFKTFSYVWNYSLCIDIQDIIPCWAMYRVPWNVIHTPWYCVMYHVVGAIILNSKKQGIKAEFRFVLWYLFVNLSLSCENVKISSSPAAHLIFLHFHTQEPNTQTCIIRLTTFCYNI